MKNEPLINKKHIKWKLWIPISVVITAILGSLILMPILIFNNLNSKLLNYEQTSTKIYNVPIVEQSVEDLLLTSYTKDTKHYLLGQEGRELFIEKIINRTGFGPEFFSLNEIIITNNEKWIAKNVSGLYLISLQQIILNTDEIIEEYKNKWTTRHEELDTITEILFHTFYHEYGHHIFNIYLVNQNNGISNDIYQNNDFQRFEEPWNKYFLEKFKKYLTYDQDTNPKDDSFILINDKPVLIKSIASKYNAKNLFTIANGKDIPNFGLKNNIFPYTWSALKTKRKNYFDLNDEILAYYYQMQEISTRKYMQLTFPFVQTKQITNAGYWLKNSSDIKPTTYLSDTLTYQESFNNSSSERFLTDAPFASEESANGLIDLFHTFIGQKGAWDISFVWYNNTAKKTVVNQGEKILWPSQSGANQIKFGGFLDDQQVQQNFKYIGYFDNIKQFIYIPIEIFNYDYNRLPNLGASTRNKIKNGAKKFYVTNSDYINLEKIKGKQLYFSDGEKNEPMKSIPDGNVGGHRSTKRFYNPEINPDIFTIYKENKVMINKK